MSHGFISSQPTNVFGFLKTHRPWKRTADNFEQNEHGDDCMEFPGFLPDCCTSIGKQIEPRRLHIWNTSSYHNARPHTAKKVDEFFTNNVIIGVPRPPYSPDFAPFDFFLFEYVKERLNGRSFDDPDQLSMIINEFCAFIEKSFWRRCFTSGKRDWPNLLWPTVGWERTFKICLSESSVLLDQFK
jgi:transposase